MRNKLDLIAKASGSESYSSRRKTPRTPLQTNSKMSNYGATLKMQNNDEEVKKMSQTTNKFTDENKRSLDNDEKSIPDIKSESQNFESDIGSKHNSFILKQNGKDILSSFKKDKEQIDMSIIESNDSNIGREIS